MSSKQNTNALDRRVFSRLKTILPSPLGSIDFGNGGQRRAAVAIILYTRGGRWVIPYVLRRNDLEDHPGQIGLPGGSVEQYDKDVWATAVREAHEELGFVSNLMEPIGRLEPMHARVSGFVVVPVVALYNSDSPVVNVARDELDGYFEVPVEWLKKPNNWQARESQLGYMKYFVYDQHVVWGLTARITQRFLEYLHEVL
jgi:8-oxo-dGTP pyrophosphatase MutT (NUDIX family)